MVQNLVIKIMYENWQDILQNSPLLLRKSRMHLNINSKHEKKKNLYLIRNVHEPKNQYWQNANRSNIAFRSHKYMNLLSSYQTQFSGSEMYWNWHK